MKQAHIFVSGFVQGVGYRRYVRHLAKKNGVNGWVRNLPDGRVEALLQGDKEKLERQIRIYEKGPFLSEVTNITVDWEEESEKYSEFSIVW